MDEGPRGVSGAVAEDMEHGIPGHASKKEWANRLQRWLKERGVSFEAEGEATRIHLDSGVYVEVAESLEGSGYDLVVTVPLPGTGEEAGEDTIRAIRDAFELLHLVGGGLRYELDNSIPEYPSLRIMRGFEDPEELVEKLIGALERFLNR